MPFYSAQVRSHYLFCIDRLQIGSAGKQLGAAVSALFSNLNRPFARRAHGLVRFIQTDDEQCVIEGTIDGLRPNEPVQINIHEYGDVSGGCERFNWDGVSSLLFSSFFIYVAAVIFSLLHPMKTQGDLLAFSVKWWLTRRVKPIFVFSTIQSEFQTSSVGPLSSRQTILSKVFFSFHLDLRLGIFQDVLLVASSLDLLVCSKIPNVCVRVRARRCGRNEKKPKNDFHKLSRLLIDNWGEKSCFDQNKSAPLRLSAWLGHEKYKNQGGGWTNSKRQISVLLLLSNGGVQWEVSERHWRFGVGLGVWCGVED